MGVFADLMVQLDLDVTTVHGEPGILAWMRDPAAEPARRWRASLEHWNAPPRRPGHMTTLRAVEYGPSGEDPLRRLCEKYAKLAKIEREKGKK